MEGFSLSEVLSSLLLFVGIVLVLFFANVMLKALHVNTSRRKLIVSFFSVVVLGIVFFASRYLGWHHSWQTGYLLIASMCWLSLGWLLSNVITYFFWEGVMLLPNGKSGAPKILRYLIGLFIWVIVVAIMMKVVYGQSVVALLTASGFVAIILGYAAQGTLGDVFSGVAVALAANIRQGHMIDVEGVDGARGEVLEMDWRCLKILSPRGDIVIVPHRKLSSSAVKNYTLANKEIVEKMTISLFADHHPEDMMPLMDQAAHDTVIYKDWPLSMNLVCFVQTSTDRSCVNQYKILLFHPPSTIKYDGTKSCFNRILYNKCRKRGMTIGRMPLSEQQLASSVSLTGDNSLVDQVLAVLQKTEVLSILPDEALMEMATLVTPEMFVTRERMMVQHEHDTDLFIVVSGKVSLHETKDGRYQQTRVMSAYNDRGMHDVFGLKAFLFAEPRRVTARCHSDQATVYRLPRASSLSVLQKYPQVVEALVECLHSRASENEALFEGLSHEDQNQHSIKQVLKQKILELFKKPKDAT